MSNDPLLSLLDHLTNTEYTDEEIEGISELHPNVFRAYQRSLREQKNVTSFRGFDKLISLGLPKEIEVISPIQQLTLEDIAEVAKWMSNFTWFDE